MAILGVYARAYVDLCLPDVPSLFDGPLLA